MLGTRHANVYAHHVQCPRVLALRAEVSICPDSDEPLLLLEATPQPACGSLLAVALLLSSKGFLLEVVGGRGVLVGGRPLPLACTHSPVRNGRLMACLINMPNFKAAL